MFGMKKIIIICFLIVLNVSVFGQNKTDLQNNKATLKGKVTDDQNRALELATVSVKGQTGGTKTDVNGEFSILIPTEKNIQIVFSSVGY